MAWARFAPHTPLPTRPHPQEASNRIFQMPKRRDELLAGGSLYWVIKGLVQVRQPLLDITEGWSMARSAAC